MVMTFEELMSFLRIFHELSTGSSRERDQDAVIRAAACSGEEETMNLTN
jgi:hypothetical protein